MSLNLRDLAPPLAEALSAIGRLPAVQYVNDSSWISAVVLTGHLLFLAVLGGAVLILNLRLLGATLTDIPAPDIERATRPWRAAGVAGTLLTGVALGLTTANTLLASGAFLVKMIALVGAVLLGAAAAREARRQDGSGQEASGRPIGRLLAFAGLGWWAASIALFLRIRGMETAAFVVALGGFVLFTAFLGRRRSLYIAGLAVALGGGLVGVEWFAAERGEAPLWLVLTPLGAAFVLAVAVVALDRRDARAPQLGPAGLAAFASSLAWITVAAAGRWIAFI